MKQKRRDKFRHLWEVGIKSVQKLIKMTGLSRAVIYKKNQRIKKGYDLKRAPGSGRKTHPKRNDQRRASQIAVKNPLFSSGQI